MIHMKRTITVTVTLIIMVILVVSWEIRHGEQLASEFLNSHHASRMETVEFLHSQGIPGWAAQQSINSTGVSFYDEALAVAVDHHVEKKQDRDDTELRSLLEDRGFTSAEIKWCFTQLHRA